MKNRYYACKRSKRAFLDDWGHYCTELNAFLPLLRTHISSYILRKNG